MANPSLFSPLSNRNYRFLFVAQLISLLGTGISTLALGLLAFKISGEEAPLVLGTALTIKMIAYLFGVPVVNGFVHKFPRKSCMIALDLLRSILLLSFPWISENWHLYGLVFLLQLCSAGFTPLFQSTIPDVIKEENEYTKALSLSRIAYDLENLLSPILATAILFSAVPFTSLFYLDSLTFLVSAMFVAFAVIPKSQSLSKAGSAFDHYTYGIKSYLKTPRLRGLLSLYMVVALASSMVIVNSITYVKNLLNESDRHLTVAFCAVGVGSILVAFCLPKFLTQRNIRKTMMVGALCLLVGLSLGIWLPSYPFFLGLWFLLGIGLSMVQTPAGKLVAFSSSEGNRSSYFAAHFSLTHACWLISYLLSGYLANRYGLQLTFTVFAILGAFFVLLAPIFWPFKDSLEGSDSPEALKELKSQIRDATSNSNHSLKIPYPNPFHEPRENPVYKDSKNKKRDESEDEKGDSHSNF